MFCACVEVVFTLLRLRTSVACENNAKAVTLTGRQADTEKYIDINRARGGGGGGQDTDTVQTDRRVVLR